MDINGWLTVITVFTAIFALWPKEDLILFKYKTLKVEQFAVMIILVFVLPYLIFFNQLKERIPFLKDFTVINGIEPTNLAFLFFFVTFLWILFRLFIWNPKVKATVKAVKYFKEILTEKPFEEFYNIFTKHTSPKDVSNSWELYRPIVMNPKFLNGIFPNHTSYLLEIWEKFENEEDFKTIFKLFLQNKDSDYYKEIKLHSGTYSLRSDTPFLNKLIKERMEESLENNVLDILADYIQEHLYDESSPNSIYNRVHSYNRVREDEGFNMQVYYHIRFYGLMYSYAIESKSKEKPRVLTFYSTITDIIIDNMRKPTEFEADSEYPTNYHWLLGEICDIINNWANSFVKEYYDNKSDCSNHIPSIFNWVMKSLYSGFARSKISANFLYSRMYYGILSTYFDSTVNDEFKTQIEKEVIGEIPTSLIAAIFNFAFDEKFAISYYQFKKGKYVLVEHEAKILKRLKEFLDIVDSRDTITLGYI